MSEPPQCKHTNLPIKMNGGDLCFHHNTFDLVQMRPERSTYLQFGNHGEHMSIIIICEKISYM